MKKILCFGEITDKYKNAIENAMRENPDIVGFLPATDDFDNIDSKTILMKCDIHSDDFLRQVIAINKKLTDGQKFFLTHCFVLFNKTGTKQPFILTDAACIPFPDENQLTHIVQNAVDLFYKIFGTSRAPFISLISAGGDTNTKLSPVLYAWWTAHKNEFSANTLRLEQLDVALDKNARDEKHISGNTADIIVVDNINTGNAILKSLTVLSNDWYGIGFIQGAKNTVILNSRSASEQALTENILTTCKKC